MNLRTHSPLHSRRPPTNRAEVTCNYYKKVGHMKYDCLELRKRKGNVKGYGLVASGAWWLPAFFE